MKNKILIIMSFLLILVIILTSYEEKTIKESPKTKKEMPSYYISYDIGIHKTDELGNPLSGVTFVLKDMNNKKLNTIPETEISGTYELVGTDDKSLDEILDMFPATRKEILKSYKTREDVENSELNMNCDTDRCYLNEVVSFILEEEKVPSGYIKEKYYVPGSYVMYYIFDGDEINHITLRLDIVSEFHLNFDDMINIDTAYEDFLLGKYDDKLISNCNNQIPFKINDSNKTNIQFDATIASTCPMNLVNKKGTIDLSVENFVNEKSNITTTNNKTLKYQIQIENKGTASSTENTIVSEVPKGLEYVEDSASHDGEYNEKEHQVEWKIEEIEAEETLELTYEAIVPKDADPNIEYIGITSINSREVSEEIKSKETIVKIEKTPITNPKTSNFVNFLVLIISGIVVTSIYITTYKNKKN